MRLNQGKGRAAAYLGSLDENQQSRERAAGLIV
jgi:hypothetical protein